MDTYYSMPLSRTAFCYIDDGMEQFGSYTVFYKNETRRGENTHVLFFKDNVYELHHVYMFQLRQDLNDILIAYRDTDYGTPKTITITHEQTTRYGPKVPQEVELIELYEWLHVRLFNSPASHLDASSSPSSRLQTYLSASCIPSLTADSPSLPLPTLPLTQSDPTCSS